MDNKTLNDVITAGKRVTNFIQDNGRSPTTVNVGGTTINDSAYNRMALQAILELNNADNSDIPIINIENAKNPASNLTNGQLQRQDYVTCASNVIKFMNDNKRIPNYLKTPIGLLSPFNIIDMYSRALNFYLDNQKLPSYINVQSVGNPDPNPSPIPDDIKKYLDPTANCQVSDPFITSLANQLKKAQTIFNYVRDRMSYDYYYNTRKGAIKTIKDAIGNCCDQTHAVNALFRAAGFPARYRHVKGRFSDGDFYHIISQVYISGKWFDCDTISNRNELGVINNWTLLENVNIYRELPF